LPVRDCRGRSRHTGPDHCDKPFASPERPSGPLTQTGRWHKDDIVELLKTGTTPEQSRVEGAMRQVVEDGLKYLNDCDLRAIADYLFAEPAIVHDVARH
jgi:hypothetical protein